MLLICVCVSTLVYGLFILRLLCLTRSTTNQQVIGTMTPSEKHTLIHVKDRGKRPKSIRNYFKDIIRDNADTFILLGGSLFVVASIVLMGLAYIRKSPYQSAVMSVLQRVVAASSLTVSSAVMMVFAKRYMFSRLSRNGIHSQSITFYNEASVTSLLGGILQFPPDPLSLCLLLYWGMGLATGLAASNVIKFVSHPSVLPTSFPAGSLDARFNSTTLFSQISSSLNLILSASYTDISLNDVGDFGVIEVITSEEPKGRILYPPIPPLPLVTAEFTAPTAVLNGFQIAIQNVTSKPDQPPSCTLDGLIASDIWLVSADTQSFTVVVLLDEVSCSFVLCDGDDAEDAQTVITQYTATAVTMGGNLTRQANGPTTFYVNGTYSTLTMSDSQWAMVIMDVICNASLSSGTVMEFGATINSNWLGGGTATPDGLWSSVLQSIIGCYTLVNTNPNWPLVNVTVQIPEIAPTPTSWFAVIGLNAFISFFILAFAYDFGKETQLHPDFLNSTRILLDASRNADLSLFNESLGSTVDALGDLHLRTIHKDFDSDGLLETHVYSSPRETLESPPSSSSPSSPHSSSNHLATHSSSQSNSRSTLHSRIPSELYHAPTETMFAPNEVIAPLLPPIELQPISPSPIRCSSPPASSDLTNPSIPTDPSPVPDQVPNPV